MTTI
jgi:co-chaperonin GroES (HSP10)